MRESAAVRTIALLAGMTASTLKLISIVERRSETELMS